MITSKLDKIKAARAKLAKLEADAATDIKVELAALPARYGYANARTFNGAVRRACGAVSGKPRKARAVITDDMRAQVGHLVKIGQSGSEIASELGISLPSVQNIKKALGLVKARK